uniref:Outer membrane beta-barrel family protein n=1 Tax=Roseihalotalea indica TaxID=2867963 RepID=A0AA49JI04_9BACT|nr:outer membrane beta-barrel family protein [Tunicatimonas sp. TK19036]
MIKSLPFFFILILAAIPAWAQQQIAGQIRDADTGAPLEFSTISILNPQDSSLVAGGLTDTDGNFRIDVPAGKYLAKVQFVSYETKFLNALDVASGFLDVGEVTLSASTATLSEVIVEGKKEQSVLELDKRVFNVAQDLSNTGRNASDILGNLPSVTVDVEGGVSLRGSQNVRILVNGKPSGLIGVGDTDGLRSLQGDMIERIEVITNPSARYDAQGSAGIINIILKKDQESGFNGSFTANIGHPENYGISGNLNYRKSWVNFFINYGVNYRRSPGNGSSYQEFYLEDTSYVTLREQERIRGGLSNNIQLGTDFIINEFNTITASGMYRVSDENNLSTVRYRDFTTNNELIKRTLREDDEREDDKNQEYELYYKRTFPQKERSLSANVQFRESGEVEDAEQVESTGLIESELTPSLFQRSLNNENELQWLLQSDYVHPFLESGKFEIGYRSTLRQIDNSYIVEQKQESGEYESLPAFTNTFQYDENIYAGYLILSNKTGKWSYQGGLRMEATDLTTHLLETAEKNDKNYVNFFPSGFLTYSLKQGRSLQASYSRRINRPGFRELNPFSSFTDPRNTRSGNPDLDPEFTDSYELGYLHNYASGNFYLGGYYRFTDGVIERVSRTVDVEGVEETVTFTRPENLSTQDAFGFEFTASQDILEWWQVSGNINIFRAITEGEAYGKQLSSDTYSMTSRLTSKWNIPDLFEVQLSGFYLAPETRPQGRRKAMGSIDLGATKDVFNRKGTLSLSIRDVLNSRKYRSETFADDFYTESEFRWGVRQITLSLTFRLNQQKNRQRDRGGRDGDGGDRGDDMEF